MTTIIERSEETKSLTQVKEDLEAAILIMEKVHHDLVNLVSEDWSAATKVPLLSRSNAILEATIDLLIDVKEERWT